MNASYDNVRGGKRCVTGRHGLHGACPLKPIASSKLSRFGSCLRGRVLRPTGVFIAAVESALRRRGRVGECAREQSDCLVVAWVVGERSLYFFR